MSFLRLEGEQFIPLRFFYMQYHEIFNIFEIWKGSKTVTVAVVEIKFISVLGASIMDVW